MHQPEWVFAFASATGNSHISENLPCQDYCNVQHFESFNIAVVSDGAGSCANSHIGACKTVELAMHHFENAINQTEWLTSEALPSQEDWHTFSKKQLSLVKNDLESFALNEKIDFKSLSCTIILAVALKNALLVTHIGDGRAGYCTNENEWFPMMTPFHGEEANETVFITSDIWHADIIDNYIESKIVNGDVKAFCLLSDGCEKASFEVKLYDDEKQVFYDPNKPFRDFYDKNIHVHLPFLKQQGKNQEEINILWKHFLETGNEKLRNETDDKTMILAVRIAPIEELCNVATGTT